MLTLPSAHEMPALGLGTWRLGESGATHAAELGTLREALDMGWRAFDTAEMYAEGGAEKLLGEALAKALRGTLHASSCSSSARSIRTTPRPRGWWLPASAACAG